SLSALINVDGLARALSGLNNTMVIIACASEAIKQYARHSVPDMWVVNLFIIRPVRRVFL
ncbi:hypothetical protein, partial [Raoultella ornithinolytica]|uniref:hypothetical protein n=1 Tax=Raoultella ornithinolytica TaxID=54291 RepID=UPI0019D49EA4